MAKPKRRHDNGYRTREFFTPKKRGASGKNAARHAAQYRLSNIPLDLWKHFLARCAAFEHPDGTTGVSVRARILTLIKQDAAS